MKKWMMGAVVSVAMIFAVTVANPSPAKAVSGNDLLIWGGVGAGGLIVLVLVATYMTRDESRIFLTEQDPGLLEPDDSKIHFGAECKNPDGTISLLCW